MASKIGEGTMEGFISSEFKGLNLRDKRLEERAKKIMCALGSGLGSCIRRLFIDQKDARQAYDFFFQPQSEV